MMFKIPSLRIEDSRELAPESFEVSSPEFPRDADLPRYRPGQKTGFYESFFSRANHPDRPLAFWVRCTLFSPKCRPDAAVGELWAVLFDGETRRNIAVKTEIPLRDCDFNPETFSVRIGEALLEHGRLSGSAASGGHHISWQLRFTGDQPPLLLLPPVMYRTAFPKAKSLVSLPMARHDGFIAVDDRRIEVNGWIGSRNHNWGERHTDRYAWVRSRVSTRTRTPSSRSRRPRSGSARSRVPDSHPWCCAAAAPKSSSTAPCRCFAHAAHTVSSSGPSGRSPAIFWRRERSRPRGRLWSGCATRTLPAEARPA